jgi:ferric-chelate reductase
VWPAVIIWAFDRIVRMIRLVMNHTVWRGSGPEHSNSAIELISDDTIRVTLKRAMNWKAGQHAYLLLPSVSKLPTEAHPFTISTIPGALDGSDGPKEKDITFLIRTRNGFTGRMRDQALKGGRFSVPVYIDGPYGSPPDLSHYSTNILVSGKTYVIYYVPQLTDGNLLGGSGVSYTLPLLLQQVQYVFFNREWR